MARAVGKDVLLDLMDEVKRLGEVQERQQATLERMGQRLDLMVVHTRELASQLQTVTQHVRSLSDDLTLLRSDVTQLSGTCAELSGGLKRLSAVLVKTLDSTADRFDELEARVTRLEKKSA